MKNKQILDLFESLVSITNLTGAKFNYSVVKNIKKLQPEIESLQKAFKNSDEFNEYNNKRVNILKKYSRKDANGEAITKTINKEKHFDIIETEEFKKELDLLISENKDIIEKKEKEIKEFNELLETENSIELFKIKLSDIPDGITTEQLAGIYLMIED